MGPETRHHISVQNQIARQHWSMVATLLVLGCAIALAAAAVTMARDPVVLPCGPYQSV